MNKELQIFNNPEFGDIRVVEIDGEPWMVGKDVATALGYHNPRDALAKHVDDEDKGVAKCDTLGGTQEMTIINESGLYSLVLSSKLPDAKKFRRWVTSEVLPSIRKHGAYIAPMAKQEYPHKSSSVGEIQKLIHELRMLMKDNDQPPEKIAEMAQILCDQFEINLPSDFVRKNPFEQLTIFGAIWTGQ